MPINEGSSARITVDLLDAAGQPAVPASLSYRIDCVTSGQVIRPSSPLSPAASVVIELTPADTVIVNAAHSAERRRVTVVAAYGSGDQQTADYEYTVRNLLFYGA